PTRTIASLVVIAPLALAACEESGSTSNNSGSQYQGQAQSQLGRTAEMGRNLADRIEGRDAAIGTAAAQASGGAGLITIPGIAMTAPEGWTSVTPSNNMRLAQFEAGDVLVTVSQIGGSTQANIDRWLGQIVDQFGEPTGADDEYDRTAAGYDTTVVEAYGAYLEGGMMGSPTRRENYGLVGAVIETPERSTFIKMTGPDNQIDDNREAFDRLLDSMQRN
ncbi:MAG: hypothetical protein AAFY46_14905, partial [Planctomycetota bacterium]